MAGKKYRKVLPPAVEGSISLKKAENIVRQVEEEKKRKKLRKVYKVIQRKYGKEIVFKDECQPVSWAQLEKIIKKEFPNCPQRKLLVMTNDDGSLGIGTDAPKGFWKKSK